MPARRAILVASFVTIGLVGCTLLWAQLPMEPAHESGQSITGALEGWYSEPDGAFRILVGYYNRNQKQELDIPIGPNNRIEPGGPDHGQPTHFVTGRQWGVFTIKVPKDFGDRKFIWTIVANGKTTAIPLSLNVLWEVSPFIEASGNTPPYLSFEEGGSEIQGPRGPSPSFTASVANPLPLTVWVSDDAKSPAGLPRSTRLAPVTLTWSQFRGPGTVTFANPKPAVEKADFKAPPTSTFTGKATTTATFSDSGDYVLLLVANDSSGEGGRGFQCCWTTARVKVTVKP